MSSSDNSINSDNSDKVSIASWNVNGIRSRVFNQKPSTELKNDYKLLPEQNSSMYNLINKYNPDIICLQEMYCESFLSISLLIILIF